MRALSRKLVPVSSGSAQAEFAGRDGFDAVGREHFAHFGELAGIVGRDTRAGR